MQPHYYSSGGCVGGAILRSMMIQNASGGEGERGNVAGRNLRGRN